MEKLSLKAIRVNRNLTQEEVAKSIGVSTKTLGFWESGKRSPKYEVLKRLLDFYGVTIDSVDL